MLIPIICILSSAGLVVIDQLLKLLMSTALKPVGTLTLIPNLLDFTYTENYGAAFSMMSGQTIVFIIITALVCSFLLIGLFLFKQHNWLSYTASAMIIAGGIGNLIDRIFHEGSYVIDYIHISFFPAIFNFADILVVVGVILALIFILFIWGRKAKKDAGKHAG